MADNISNDKVVTMHYTLRDKEDNVLDQSVGGEPLAYLHGHRNIIPGLETQLSQKQTGDKLKVHVTPAEGYGEYDPEKKFQIDRRQLGDVHIEPGMALELHADDGDTMVAMVVGVNEKAIEVDANHPMAGQDLFFEVEIVGIREATKEEIAHGHVHGPGGHHH